MEVDTEKVSCANSMELAAELEEMIHQAYHCTDKKWSDTSSSPFTTTFDEGLIKAAYDRRHLFYWEIWVGLWLFQVSFIGSQPKKSDDANMEENANMEESEVENEDYDDFIGVPIPLFDLIQEVSIDNNEVMHYNCCNFEGWGYFYEQQVCVADYISEHLGDTFDGFTHQYVLLWYCSAFMHLAYCEDTPVYIQAMFHVPAPKDVTVSTLKKLIPSTMEIMPQWEILPAIDRMKNYENDDIDSERIDGMFCFTLTPNVNGKSSVDDLGQSFGSMLIVLQSVTTHSAETMFDESVSNFSIPEVVQGVCARSKMRSTLDTGFALADWLDVDGVKAFEDTVLGFDVDAWASQKLNDVGADGNYRR